MNRRRLVFPAIVVAIVAIVFLALWADNGFKPLRSADPPIQIRYDMYYESKLSPQQPSTFFADRKGMRNPPPGTVPRDGAIFTDTSFAESEAHLRTPYPDPPPAVLARGANRFAAFCAPCHSLSGQDTTEVVRRGMQKPPNLVASHAKGLSDAHIFYIISRGQNVMPSYADKLAPEDRWAVIAHVRALQREPLKYPEAAPAADTTKRAAPAGGK